MSVTDYFNCQSSVERILNCGHLSPYLDHFADYLAEQGFWEGTIKKHISNVAHLSYSLKSNPDLDILALNDHITCFLDEHMPVCKCKGWKRARKSASVSPSLNRFTKYLHDYHGIGFNLDARAYPEIHDEFLCWLSDVRDLCKSSINLRSSYLNQFLKWYKRISDKDLEDLKVSDVECFFLEATRRWGKSYKRSLQTTLRTFFDFCFERAYTQQNFRFFLPTINTYQLSDIPKEIKDNEVEKLLKSIDLCTDSGKRIYAILKLLCAYGVRGGQVIRIKLDDINWHKEEITFPAFKGGKSCTFPLTTDVGNSLLEYLRNVRGKSNYQEVFLTLRAPRGPLRNSKCLSQIIRTAMMNAGVESPSMGSHCFRHNFVSRMLRQNESYKNIADLIGHRSIQSTFIYTKIDFNSLAEVPLELPEVHNGNV